MRLVSNNDEHLDLIAESYVPDQYPRLRPDQRQAATRDGMVPHSYAAEYSLLAALVMHGAEAMLTDECMALTPTDFWQPEHALVWEAAQMLLREQADPSWVTLADALQRLGTITEVDRLVSVDAPGYDAEAWLVELMMWGAHYVLSPTGSAPAWARLVADTARRRRQIEDAQRATRQAYVAERSFAQQPTQHAAGMRL